VGFQVPCTLCNNHLNWPQSLSELDSGVAVRLAPQPHQARISTPLANRGRLPEIVRSDDFGDDALLFSDTARRALTGLFLLTLDTFQQLETRHRSRWNITGALKDREVCLHTPFRL